VLTKNHIYKLVVNIELNDGDETLTKTEFVPPKSELLGVFVVPLFRVSGVNPRVLSN
jgi:hypothetical protein